MPRQIAHRNLPQLLLKARENLICHFRPILKHFGLTEQQWRILRSLAEREPLEPRELCDLCQILSPSLVGVLARMEEMGVIERHRFSGDQRRLQIRLSPAGDALVAAIAPAIETQYRHLEAALGKDLIARLYDVLDQVNRLSPGAVRHVDPAAPEPTAEG